MPVKKVVDVDYTNKRDMFIKKLTTSYKNSLSLKTRLTINYALQTIGIISIAAGYIYALHLTGLATTLNITLLIAFLTAVFGLITGAWASLILTTAAILMLFLLQFLPFTKVSANPQTTMIYIAGFGYTLSLVAWAFRKKLTHIQKLEKRSRYLVDQSLHPIILKDKDGTVLQASQSIQDLLSTGPSKVVGKKLNHFIHPKDQSVHDTFIQDLLKNPGQRKVVRLRFIKNGEEVVWLRNDAINLLNDKHIQAIVSSLQDITKSVELDKKQQKLLELEKEARTQAEKAVQERDEFVAIASHELRTPLTNVLLQLQATIRQILSQSLADFSGEKLVKSLTVAEQQGQRLAILIKDLASASLLSGGHLEINKEKVKMKKIIETLLSRFDTQVKQNGTKIKTDLQDEHEGFWDPVRLEQALSNLITNALKYGNDKTVTISSKSTPKTTTVTIKDQGQGISKEDQKHLFKLFYRAKNTGKKGLGVGLFITREIVEAHQGEISFQSTPGKGTAFTIKLPNKIKTE